MAAFHWVAQQQGLNFQLLEEVRRINDAQKDVFFNKVRAALWTLRGKKLAALGLAFKCDTDDIRESPGIGGHSQAAGGGRKRDRLRSGGHRSRQGGAAAYRQAALRSQPV